MNTELPEQGTANYLGIVAVVMGILCIVAAVIMTYCGKTMSIGNTPIAAGLVFLVAGLVLIIASLVGYSKQKHQQVSIRVWHVFLPVLIVLLIVYVSTRYSLQEDHKYAVLVDLIMILLALTGTIGYGIYRWISRSVSDRVALAIKEGQDFTAAQVQAAIGLWYFDQYKIQSEQKEEMGDIWKKLVKMQSDQENRQNSEPKYGSTNTDPMSLLTRAIERTTKALEFTKELDQDKYDKFICICKNNLAYYLAEKKMRQGKIEEGEDKLAREYARFAWERIEKYPNHKAAWADTYQFVNQYFPSKSD